MNPIVVTTRYRPHEIMILIWSVAAGVLHFVTKESRPNFLSLVLPHWAVIGWYILLGCAGIVGLVGVLWKEVTTGMALERAGMVGLAAPTAIYAMCAFYIGGWQAIVGGGLIACWSAACVWRVIQIHQDLRQISGGNDAPERR